MSCDLIDQNRNCYLHVRGKGAKDRLVPVPKLYRRLRLYVERGRPKDAVSSRKFLSHRHRPNGGDYEPLTTSGVDQMIRNVAVMAGLTKRVYPAPPPLLCRHLAALARHEPHPADSDPWPLVAHDDPSARVGFDS